MRSFKEFLLEEVGHLPTFHMNVQPSGDYAEENWTVVKEEVQKSLKKHGVETKYIDYENDYVSVELQNVPQTLSQDLESIWTTLHGDLYDLMDVSDGHTFFEVEWPIAYSLDYHDTSVFIQVQKDGLTFKGIEKLLNAEHIDVCLNDYKIGLLPLIHLKNMSMMHVSLGKNSHGTPDQSLLNFIMKKHNIGRGTGDLLDFQEDLISNGFKDYAK